MSGHERHKKHKRLHHKNSSAIRLRPAHPNHIWSIAFVHDKLSNGRSYKMLTVLDEYTRQACVLPYIVYDPNQETLLHADVTNDSVNDITPAKALTIEAGATYSQATLKMVPF